MPKMFNKKIGYYSCTKITNKKTRLSFWKTFVVLIYVNPMIISDLQNRFGQLFVKLRSTSFPIKITTILIKRNGITKKADRK
ncbi:hypothetical protein C3V39_02980 [Prevotella sp. oral taxon 820]|nr:hypothetical protein C3V39_02980 [Prevotella sp. oral taxon 820]